MSRERHFRQSDVTAAVKAVQKAGESVARVEIEPDGTVNVIVGQPEEPEETRLNNTKQVLERFHAVRPKRQARTRKSDAS